MAEQIIKSRERVRKYAEVLTPKWLVEKMLDMLQEEQPPDYDAFAIHTTFLEPACGNGNFLVEIYRRKLQRCHSPADALQALGTIYGVDILHDNVEEARARLYAMYAEAYGPSMEAIAILAKNIVAGNFLTGLLNDGTPIWFLDGMTPYEEPKRRKSRKRA